MIWLISDRLERGLCDDVLEVAWSTMWNVTDETPTNCKKFLENKGMEYFLKCLEVKFLFCVGKKFLQRSLPTEIFGQRRTATQHDGPVGQRRGSP